MSKKSRKNQTRLNNLLIVLILATLLLIMSTYAWFTANREVAINAINLNVTTSNGLQISANGIDWKSVLTNDDIANARGNYDSTNHMGGYPTAVNQLAKDIAPVSTPMTLDDAGHLRMFYGRVDADLADPSSPTYGQYKLSTSLQTDTATAAGTWEEDESKNYYVAFDFFLKLGNSEAADLYMAGKVKDTSASQKGIENAARVALVEGTANSGHTTSESVTTIQGLDTIGGTVISWEPNNDSHTAYAVDNHQTLGWYYPAVNIATGDNQPVVPWDGVVTEVSDVPLTNCKASDSTYGTNFTTITPTWSTKKGAVVNNSMPNQLATGVTKYRAYLWVEGQDVDCENYASGSSLYYEIRFSLDQFTAVLPDVNP